MLTLKVRLILISTSSGATDYPLLVAVSSGTNPCSGRRFVCNDLRQGYWRDLKLQKAPKMRTYSRFSEQATKCRHRGNPACSRGIPRHTVGKSDE